VYCQTPDGPSLTISAYPAAAMADVRLSLAMGAGLCSVPAPAVSPRFPAGADRIPRLYPPEGVLLQASGGGGGSQNRWASEAGAMTDRPTAELEAFFAQQLAAAGWTRQAGQAAAALSWSTWQVPGEGDWQGVLLVIEGPGPDRRSLSVRVESATAAPGSGGAYSVYTVGGGTSSSYMVPGPAVPVAPLGPLAPPGPGFAPGPTPTPTPTASRP
jgi:hypothetical protein